VKIALPDIPPLIQATIRSAGGTLIVALWAWLRGHSLDIRDGTLKAGLLVGFLFGLEFVFLYRGLLYTTVSRAVLFLYIAPFVVVVGARWLIPGERFRPSQWLGLLLSFSGLVLAFGVPAPSSDPYQWLGDVMLLMSGIAWGATTLAVKASRLNHVSAEKTLLYQLAVSVPVLGVGALLLGEQMTSLPRLVPVLSLLWQTLWIVSITFLLWFMMVVKYSASRLSAFTFFTPLFGVAAGHLVMGDPITPAFAGAAALVIAGLILVNRPR
jgi:drug/metabolite transporter (DMT)-like permease